MRLDIPEPDSKGLREFALVTGALAAALFGLAVPWLLGLAYPVWPWLLAAALAAWGLAAPATLRPVYRAWMRFGLVMNRITTPVILGVVFFAVITPVALVMKLIGRDPLARAMDADTASYRKASVRSSREKMEHPY